MMGLGSTKCRKVRSRIYGGWRIRRWRVYVHELGRSEGDVPLLPGSEWVYVSKISLSMVALMALSREEASSPFEFLAAGFLEVPAGFRVDLEILRRVVKRHPVARHELIHLGTGLKTKHTPHLRTPEETSAVTVDGEALERVPRQIAPLAFEAPLDVSGSSIFNSMP